MVIFWVNRNHIGYTIKQNGTAKLFTDFSLYVEALQTQLDNGRNVKSVTAQGNYDDLTATLIAERLVVKME